MTIAEGGKLVVAMRALVCAGCLAYATAVPAQAAAEGFDESVTLAGQTLQLNGAGLKSIFIVKSYVAALYVPERSQVAQRLIAQSGPRRLAMRMLADKSAARLVRSFGAGLRNNHDSIERIAMQSQIDTLLATLEQIGTLRQGDLVTFDLIDSTTRIAVNGTPTGQPIEGERFYAALLRIFLGEQPADPELKRGLLGIDAAASRDASPIGG
jgi:hypothetical protein